MGLPRSRLACLLLGIATPLVPGLLLVGVLNWNQSGEPLRDGISKPEIRTSKEAVLTAPIIKDTVRTSSKELFHDLPSIRDDLDNWDTDYKQHLRNVEDGVCSSCISGKGLIWPVQGPISSPYSPGHPLGIDIDLEYSEDLTVQAATDGMVVFAGGNKCCSYGLYIVLVSPEGVETLYAHLGKLEAVKGETVEQGQKIAVAGSSGYSTGPHLHFEVIDNGVRVNPLNYLP